MGRMPIKIIVAIVICMGLILAGRMNYAGAGTEKKSDRAQAALPKELRNLKIKDHFISSSLKKVGLIHALNGQVVVMHRVTKDAYFGREGNYIYENDSITTLSGARCRIKFFNDDVITMAPDTNFSVESFYDERAKRTKRSVFSMLKGKAMFYALRLFRYKEVRFSLKTPTAIVGVRGTKFGAHVYWVGEDRRSTGGVQVADSGNRMGRHLVQISSETGVKSYTDCFSEDGNLDINGKSVGPGEIYRGETESIVPTPPGFVRVFEAATEVKSEGTSTGGEEKAGGEKEKKTEGKSGEKKGDDDEGSDDLIAVVGEGDQTSSGDLIDVSENVTEITHQEAGTKITEEANDISQGKTAGSGSAIAMLITSFGGSAVFGAGKGPIYVSHKPNPFYGGAETHFAYEGNHEDNSSFLLRAREKSDTDMGIYVEYFDWGSGNNKALGTPHYFQWHQGGHYLDENGHDYLSWGYWEDTDIANFGLIGTGSAYYAATGKIWEIEGDLTHPDYISYLQQQGAVYTYSGEAKGVLIDNTGPWAYNLSGPFSCHVNFGNRNVSGFEINAGDANGHTVHLLNGTGIVDSDSTFSVEGLSGTINGNSVVSDGTNAGGGFVGGKAQGVAGNWNAYDGGTNWAAGEFHGHR